MNGKLKQYINEEIAKYWKEKYGEENIGYVAVLSGRVERQIMKVANNEDEASKLSKSLVNLTFPDTYTVYPDGDHHSPTYGLPKEPETIHHINLDKAIETAENEAKLKKLLDSFI